MKESMSKEVRDKVEKKFYEMQEKRMEMSTDLAEEMHHKECKIKCCGEHQLDNDDKCIHCNMTQDQIDDHNMEWWHCVDEIEANHPVCSQYANAEFHLGEWLDKNPR